MSSRDYYDAYWQRDAPSPLTDPLATVREAQLVECLEAAGARVVLDAGCGGGQLVAALQGRGYDARGFDVAERAVRIARERDPAGDYTVQSVEELPWPAAAGSVDAVASFEVIEHLLEPRRLLAGAREVLRDGGHLALTTPYHGVLKNVVLALTRFDRHFDVGGDHIRFFTDTSLRSLLAAEGFQTVRVTHYGRLPYLWKGVFVWARKR